MVPRLALPNVMSHRLTNGFKLIHQQTLLHFLLLLHSRDLFTFWVERTARNTSRDSVQKYNHDTNMWQEVLPLSSPRAKVCAIADGSYLYAIGGSDSANQYLDINC